MTTRYATHPSEKQFHEWDQRQKEKRNNYWRRLRTAFAEYQTKNPEGNLHSFRYYMEHQYGVRVNMVSDNIDGSYQIIDDAKHTMFLLKYQ